MLQSILNIILSPAMLPIVIGLIAGGSRLMRWANENKAKRQEQFNNARARDEYLRTGKPADKPVQRSEAGSPTSVQPQTNASAGKTRLEELRQQRIEQLRKIREQRSSPAAPQLSRAASPKPSPLRARGMQNRASAQAQASATGRVPTSVPSAQRIQRPAVQPLDIDAQQESLAQRRAKAQRQRQAAQSSKPTPSPASKDGRSRLSSLEINPELNQHVGTLHIEHADDPIESSYGVTGATHHSTGIRKRLKDRSSVRQAIVLNEVLSAPVALRVKSL